VNSTDEYSSEKLTVRYYPGETGDTSRYTMFEDDGKTFGTIQKGAFELLKFTGVKREKDEYFIQLERKGRGYEGIPSIRKMKVEIVDLAQERKYKVRLNGKKLKPLKSSGSTGYYFDKKNRFVVAFDWEGQKTNILVK